MKAKSGSKITSHHISGNTPSILLRKGVDRFKPLAHEKIRPSSFAIVKGNIVNRSTVHVRRGGKDMLGRFYSDKSGKQVMITHVRGPEFYEHLENVEFINAGADGGFAGLEISKAKFTIENDPRKKWD